VGHGGARKLKKTPDLRVLDVDSGIFRHTFRPRKGSFGGHFRWFLSPTDCADRVRTALGYKDKCCPFSSKHLGELLSMYLEMLTKTALLKTIHFERRRVILARRLPKLAPNKKEPPYPLLVRPIKL